MIARGEERRAVFGDDTDRQSFLHRPAGKTLTAEYAEGAEVARTIAPLACELHVEAA